MLKLPAGIYRCHYCDTEQANADMASRNQCKKCHQKQKSAWSQANPERVRVSRHKHDALYADKIKEQKRIWRKAHPDTHRDYQRAARRKVIDHYGAVCVCCGESEYKFLAIDHVIPIKSSGQRSSTTVYQVIREGYPNTFQILCHNCNLAKGFWGQCPHLDACDTLV